MSLGGRTPAASKCGSRNVTYKTCARDVSKAPAKVSSRMLAGRASGNSGGGNKAILRWAYSSLKVAERATRVAHGTIMVVGAPCWPAGGPELGFNCASHPIPPSALRVSACRFERNMQRENTRRHAKRFETLVPLLCANDWYRPCI